VPVRLQKFIASTGIASRRKAEELMSAGRVFVNGQKVTKLGTTADPEKDIISVNGKLLNHETPYRYIALNKPVGVTCTAAEIKGERTVYDLVPHSEDLVIAGRLDKDSDGLVILTNDGELVNHITHPRYQHQKEYEVTTVKPLEKEALEALRRGVRLKEGKATFDRLTKIARLRYRVVLHQGWKRQIRRMIGEVRNDVAGLTRTRINKLTLENLRPGEYREVRRSEIL
jgi:23S rRNA pseudouridine2605 synthase